MTHFAKTLLVGTALIAVSAPAFAIDCPAARILNVQAQKGSILVRLEDQDWHRIGATDGLGVEAMYGAALAAHVAGLKVVIRYPDGYDCSAYNTSIDAAMIRTVLD